MQSKQTLNRQLHALGDSREQIKILSNFDEIGIAEFQSKLDAHNQWPLVRNNTEVFQMNLGKMCNQTCVHCHVDAGPDRKEIMTKQVMEYCLEAIDDAGIRTVDLTGGAPEMNVNFRWLVSELHRRNCKIIVRCNLTIINANPKYYDLPIFYRDNLVEIVSSLPYFNAARTDAQRGSGVFESSIKALKQLNDIGYGIQDELQLNLVYNPSGAFIPTAQAELESQFKKKLFDTYGIKFNQLYAITNLPISRFLHYLIESDNYVNYMQELASSFNPLAVDKLMCKNTISVSWDGYIYDCDFNQMLDIKHGTGMNIKDYNKSKFESAPVLVNQHCYGCTAAAGSSCGGQIS